MKQNDLVLVTGAAGGIGSCISKHITSKYDNILLTDFDWKLMDCLKAELVDTKKNVMYEIIDITDQNAISSLVQRYEMEYDIVVLINCAGISVDGTSDVEYQSFRKMMDVNFWGSFHTMYSVVPYMCKRNKGYLINLVSQSGKRARAKTGAYAATKFALMGYIEGLQKELADSNVRVSALCPGMVNTRQTDDEPDFDKQEMIQPEELLHAIDFLLSVPVNVSVKEIVYECIQQVKNPRGE